MSALKVWLTQKNIQILCTIVYEDQSSEAYSTRSLNMRGAQREVTHALSTEFEPAGRWTQEHPGQTSRVFRSKEKV